MKQTLSNIAMCITFFLTKSPRRHPNLFITCWMLCPVRPSSRFSSIHGRIKYPCLQLLNSSGFSINLPMCCCSGLNFQDLIVRQGAIDSPPKTPFILGFECAGEIEQVGEGVTNFKVRITFLLLGTSHTRRSGLRSVVGLTVATIVRRSMIS